MLVERSCIYVRAGSRCASQHMTPTNCTIPGTDPRDVLFHRTLCKNHEPFTKASLERTSDELYTMCGGCSSAGPIVSYLEGDYIRLTYPQSGIHTQHFGKVLSIDDQFGIEAQVIPVDEQETTKATTSRIVWIKWAPFVFVSCYPGFYCAGLRTVPPAVRQKLEQERDIAGLSIGHGWLKEPFVLNQ